MKPLLTALGLIFAVMSIAPTLATDKAKPDGFATMVAENKSPKKSRVRTKLDQCRNECIDACQGAVEHNCFPNCMCNFCSSKSANEKKKCGPVS
ncbi:MAG: hypothetical protein WAN86_22315, partial [Hyphomicrobiaceae bacterium]